MHGRLRKDSKTQRGRRKLKTPTIKALFFDFGNVCATYDVHRFLDPFSKQIGIQPDEVKKILIGEVPHGKSYGPFFERLESGMMSSSRFFFEITQLFNCAGLIDYEPFARWWSSIFIAENKELDQLLTRIPLQKFLLSNTNRMIFNRYIAHTMIVQHHFREWEQRILSYVVGAVKPDLPIYREALRRAGVHPSHCLFIDDLPENITAWEALGGRGIVYDARCDSIEILSLALAKFGVVPK